ncbi:MAG: hypothetical protein ACRET2_02605, partial [Steroidobacteraceae bacterium]
RLAVVWVVGWLVLIVIGLALGGTMEKGAWVAIPLVLLGPAAILLALSWLFAPRQRDRRLPR